MISRDWISTTVAKWQRARPERYSESAHSALARLEKAHGNKARPVLFLLLDGLDEVRSSGIDVRDAIKATLDFAFEEYELSQHTSSTPRIVVVATCRALEELDDVWPTPLEDCRATVLVGDFSRSELLSAATNALPRALSARFAASARSTGDQPDESDSLLTVDSNVLTKMPAKEEVLEALTHPLLWGLFCRLPDERTQHAVLDGDPSSLNTLCRSYIVEFSKKTRARERDLRAETTEHMLRAVAMSSSETIRLGKSKDWIGPLTAKGRFTEPNAERLFQEACSFGLVASDGSGIWRWRHAMVREYLSNEGTAEV